MATEIIMPKLGVDMQEGQIIEWKKKEGDEVKEGEILLEIMSDKTNMELEAEATGTLIKILRKDGEIIMPKLGVDMQEGQIIEWKKKEGDEVKEGEILLEIMSDKTNMELEAEATGTLIKILRKDGEKIWQQK